MYFEIENTPESVRRSRRTKVVEKNSPKDECPRLILAPFKKPPLMVFDNVQIGTTCEKELEIRNPSKQVQRITLDEALPPGLVIVLPEEWLVLEPEKCYSVIMMWTPMQPTALRKSIRFTNEDRGRYEVVVVLKSIMTTKKQPKGFKTSPGKNKKKKACKRSPVAIYKEKSKNISQKTTLQSTEHHVLKNSNKENISHFNDFSLVFQPAKWALDSSVEVNFDISEVFRRNTQTELLQNTYDKSSQNLMAFETPRNVLKPSNKRSSDISVSELFDDINFTPLKTNPIEKLNKGPNIIVSLNSDSDLNDSLEIKTSNKENETHSIICIPPQIDNKREAFQQKPDLDQFVENVQNIKVPSSSPKELNSPNFSMNTEFSRISELSFFPQRFSTERKIIPNINDTHDIFEDPNTKLQSDTYTKDSPSTPLIHLNQINEARPTCRQSLFRESQQYRDTFERNYLPTEHNVWNREMTVDPRSPPRSVTPPLQSIPEESSNFCETMDRSNKQNTFTSTFTMNRTFDKAEKNSFSISTRQSWSKKYVRAEPAHWKVPTAPAKKSLKPKATISKKESLNGNLSRSIDNNKTITQNVSHNQFGNVYSQSTTVDPFLSASYFYDEAAVHKFEANFRSWLNHILTPPADLESNIEQKIDVAWLESRNKEVPAAPTKEQVCSTYHNSRRLESLRRSARALLMSSEMAQVFQKLNAQIEKKLIAIRTDRNLHLDVGLQRIIMELLLSYNPLWLRIGLEAIYGIVLPLKSNSDIDGLTTFIIQRMFRNPYLKNKHSKSSAPNMLLPAYMEAIKKFTLKKFFMLVFFLDQAKQKKLIPHDPCLFCRNAVCKESREIIIRFTRELIAGIGDITKHLRPIGYVVCHKQSYLDEYKYAVHNIALDIRDGVRITRVMEIILMKNGLLTQLRTPAISRLQKIHNVQVALTALKEANFVIVGDITAQDIADGHREKTLSLLWQLIHVFRAPLFEKAASVIQIWWKKKYEVIMEKRKEEKRVRQKLNTAASVIQHWWRRVQYDRLVEEQMKQITTATIVLQKYCRMWICRTHLRKQKRSVLTIEKWYRSVKIIREAKETLQTLKSEREKLRQKSATILQSYVRRWLCMREYRMTVEKIVLIQSLIRRFTLRKRFVQLKKSATCIQIRYRGKLVMREEMIKLAEKRKAAITIQSNYRMLKQRRQFDILKKSVKTIEERYLALLKMRKEMKSYHELKRSTVLIQARWRGIKCRKEYSIQKNLIVKLQRRVRANILMKKEKEKFVQLKKAAITLQQHVRSYQTMKKMRQAYIQQKKSTILIQRRFRAQRAMKAQKQSYIRLKNAAIVIQTRYRAMLAMRRERSLLLNLRNACIFIQRRRRAQILMRYSKNNYQKLRAAVTTIQHRFRALLKMKEEHSKYLKLKSSCIIIQNAYRAFVQGKRERQKFLNQKHAAVKIQKWFRNCKKGRSVQQEYKQTIRACVTIQRVYRAFIIGRKERKEYLKLKTATLRIQNYYRCYIEMKRVREEFLQLKTATVLIQKYYKSKLETNKQRREYLRLKSATVFIQRYYRQCRETKRIRNEYCALRKSTILIQKQFRNKCVMRIERQTFLKVKESALTIQRRYRALLAMRVQRNAYLKVRAATIVIQTRFRAQRLMKEERIKFMIIRNACVTIQRRYRDHQTRKFARQQYLTLRKSAIVVQQRYRALLAMRKERKSYLSARAAAVIIQRKFRAQFLMKKQRCDYQKILKASITIQRRYIAFLAGKIQRLAYIRIKATIVTIQTWFRRVLETRKIRNKYQQLRDAVLLCQRKYKAILKAREFRHQFLKLKMSAIIVQSTIRMFIQRRRFLKIKSSAQTIQRYFCSYKLTKAERLKFIQLRTFTIKLQSFVRSYIQRKRFLRYRNAVITIQVAYRLKKQQELLKILREKAAVCIQKYARRYLVQTRYQNYREKVLFIQKMWRGMLVTRLLRCEFLQKKRSITKLQARVRGYLVRQHIQQKKEEIQKNRERQKLNWAASVIQAHYRAYKVRVAVDAADSRVTEIRRRWRLGALRSSQLTFKERNEHAMDVLRNDSDINSVIRAFRSLDLLTEVFPKMYERHASSIVRQVYVFMSGTNRSLSSIEVLKSAGAVLANLTRYRGTGPKIYNRDRIEPILKFMLRFSNSEIQLFCILCTYLWLYSKYDGIREDLMEFLNMPENKKTLATIKGNVERIRRMASNAKNKFAAPQPHKFVSHTGRNVSMNFSLCSNASNTGKSEFVALPSLEPDYGLTRADKPRFFEDPHQAIICLFQTYNLS